jgi:hypothetical protein
MPSRTSRRQVAPKRSRNMLAIVSHVAMRLNAALGASSRHDCARGAGGARAQRSDTLWGDQASVDRRSAHKGNSDGHQDTSGSAMAPRAALERTAAAVVSLGAWYHQWVEVVLDGPLAARGRCQRLRSGAASLCVSVSLCRCRSPCVRSEGGWAARHGRGAGGGGRGAHLDMAQPRMYARSSTSCGFVSLTITTCSSVPTGART